MTDMDPARALILQLQDEAMARNEAFEPTAEELRLLLVRALPETAGIDAWAARLGCSAAFLVAVLDGRERAAGDMLDILGMEWIPRRGAYADPLLDLDASTLQMTRWAKGPTAATRRLDPPLQRIARAPRPGAAPLDIFAVGVAAPKPREEK